MGFGGLGTCKGSLLKEGSFQNGSYKGLRFRVWCTRLVTACDFSGCSGLRLRFITVHDFVLCLGIVVNAAMSTDQGT